MIMSITYSALGRRYATPDGKVWQPAGPSALEVLDPQELIFLGRGQPVPVRPGLAQLSGMVLVGDFRDVLPELARLFTLYIQTERVCPDCKAQPRSACKDDCANRRETP